jgi:perosamine synthetase
VFADIEERTYGLDTSDVERKITPRTKAIMPIHYGGSPCQIVKLQKLAERYNLLLIEDAAESLGASVKDKKVGSFGDSAILSFCSPKVITTGEGGMVLTSSKDTYEKVKLICNQGRAETSNYFSTTEQMQYVSLGYNFRMSTITAALGLSQMNKLEEIIYWRRYNTDYLNQKLSRIEEIEIPFTPPDYFQVYQMYTIRVRDSRDRLKEYLNEQGIGAKVYFEPVHKSLFYKRLGYHIELPVTEKVCNEVLTLPMYPELSIGEMNYMVEKIKEFFV